MYICHTYIYMYVCLLIYTKIFDFIFAHTTKQFGIADCFYKCTYRIVFINVHFASMSYQAPIVSFCKVNCSVHTIHVERQGNALLIYLIFIMSTGRNLTHISLKSFDMFRQLLLLASHMGASCRFWRVHTDVHDVTRCNVSTVPDVSTCYNS